MDEGAASRAALLRATAVGGWLRKCRAVASRESAFRGGTWALPWSCTALELLQCASHYSRARQGSVRADWHSDAGSYSHARRDAYSEWFLHGVEREVRPERR